jgi:very-short-patch-repair endonuclease
MQQPNDHTPFDVTLARLAIRQHGIVTLRQLKCLGLSKSGVSRRANAGKLHRIHRGVYSVGHPLLTQKAHWLAAVLACGKSAALSHHSAGALWGIHRRDRSRIDVTTPRRTGRTRPGIHAHSACQLDSSDVTTVSAIPCTTVPRTLLDLAEVVDHRTVERAIDRAEVLGVFDGRALEDVLSRADGRRGAPVLRSILADYELPAITESELEERFLAICAQAGIRRPRVNQWIALDGDAVRVDFLWPDQGLVVETDGRHVHGSRRAFERDRRRDQRLLLAGYRVMRCTWRQIADQPDEVAKTVSTLLGGRGKPHRSLRADE